MSQSSLSEKLASVEIYIKSLSKGPDEVKKDAEETVLRLWEQIPPEWRTKCKPPPSDRVKVAKWKKDPINVPKIILTQLDLWDRDPSSILTSELEVSMSPAQDFLSRLYLALDHTHFQSALVKAVRLRILQIAFHNLMNRLNVRHICPDSTAETEFFSRIKVRKDDAEIGKRSKGWAKIGGKYASLSAELGGLGSMICLPGDISAYKLERIPLTGEVRVEAVAALKARGINDSKNDNIQRCYVVGQKISAMMNAELDSYFLEYSSPQADMTTSRRKRRRTQITDVSTLLPSASVVAIDRAGTNPDVDNLDDPRQSTSSSRPAATVTSDLETSNADPNTGALMVPPTSITIPRLTPSGFNTSPDLQPGYWSGMADFEYWNDMTDVTSDFWNDMNQVSWPGLVYDLPGTGGTITC